MTEGREPAADGTERPGSAEPGSDPAAVPGEEPGTGNDPAAGTGSGPEQGSTSAAETRRQVGRRGLLGAVGASVLAGGALGFGADRLLTRGDEDAQLAQALPLRGEHQQGITTPAQDHLFCAAFDVTTDDLEALRQMMADWCAAAAQMTAGELVGGEPLANPQAVPQDTGEVWGYPPSSLTITVGVGATLFRTADGEDRFGLAGRIPTVLDEGMPRFGNENLREADSDGDLLVQACADDAQVAVHAVRNLARIATGTAALRWTQTGHGRTASTSTTQETPRNLFGFKDGTNNVKQEDGAQELDAQLWVQPGDEGGDWLAGGSYLAMRKIRMRLETWDRLRLLEQEEIIGRDKRYGAPLSVTAPDDPEQEFETVDLDATADGAPAIPVDAHIRVVAPENHEGHRMLRRGYNYTEGTDSLGQFAAGLFFLAFVRDPREGFYPALSAMTQSDALVEYIQHIGSGLFAILPGVGEGETMFGQALFGG